MYFAIAAVIVAISASAITLKTLLGYVSYPLWYKVITTVIILAGWFAPMWLRGLRHWDFLSGLPYAIIQYTGYFLFGFAFLLLCLILLRDILWFFSYDSLKLFKSAPSWLNPKDYRYLKAANSIIVGAALILSFYALYEGMKQPAVKEVSFSSPKISKQIRLVQLTDLHITRATPDSWIKTIVERVNALHPDLVVITGDLADDDYQAIWPKVRLMSGLDAVHGVYIVTGNHELYNSLFTWIVDFRMQHFKVLINNGSAVPGLNLFIGGIPDNNTAAAMPYLQVDLAKTFKSSNPGDYRILLSHYPLFKNSGENQKWDLQLSGHTHGGQIYPFHYLVTHANKFLAGAYKKDGAVLYVSRGAGFWGPPMRLLAPSEITLITLKPESVANEKKSDS